MTASITTIDTGEELNNQTCSCNFALKVYLPSRVPNGYIQRARENLLALMKEIVHSPYLTDPETDRHRKVVSFDVLGLFSAVVYSVVVSYADHYPSQSHAAADPPTELSTTQVGTTISVFWTPPSPTPYGYRIYYQAEGDQGPPQSEVVTDGSTTSHDLTVPQSGVSYSISIQTLCSIELPSAVTEGVSTGGKIITHQ